MQKIAIIIIISSAVTSAQSASERVEAFKKSVEAESKYNYSEAIAALDKIDGKSSSDYLVNLRLGWLYYKTNKFQASIKFYNNAVKISDGSIEALLGLTYPLSSLYRWSEIESVYQRILDKDELNYTANLNLGKYYFNTKNFLNAKVKLQKIVDNYPSDYSGNIYLGWTLYYLGDEKNASKHFERALIAIPGDSSAMEGFNLVK